MTVDPTDGPEVKGWCPGAHRPMASGDGLVFRIRPFYGELTVHQARGLCDASERFGNGVLDLTSRANFQIRGVATNDQDALARSLEDLGLLDADPAVEGHRNILMPHDWTAGDLTHRLYTALLTSLPCIPHMPEKIGFAVDTSACAGLANGSADFRFELDETGGLLLRADGCTLGRPITEADALDALSEMIRWFCEKDGCATGRMSRLLERADLPEAWSTTAPRKATASLYPGETDGGTIIGAPFGKIATEDLRSLMAEGGATHIRPMLNRMLFLKGVVLKEAPGFETSPSRLMQVHACPGAPFCPQATVATMDLARMLAAITEGTLHISGCSKGCAHPLRADLTLVGRNGRFDLVSDGRPWDEPRRHGLDPSELPEALRET